MRWSDIVRSKPATDTPVDAPPQTALDIRKAKPSQASPSGISEDETNDIEARIKEIHVTGDNTASAIEKCCVLDTGGFLHAHDIHKLADRFYTVPEVLKEIRDARHRHMLENLTFELTVQSPDPKYYEFALEETQRTGDVGFLSETDLCVIALTKQLSDEFGAVSPSEWDGEEDAESDDWIGGGDDWITTENIHTLADALPKTKKELAAANAKNDVIAHTANGFLARDASSGGKEDERPSLRAVSCFTTDFTVQNALIQLGITAIGVEGRQIKYVKTWVLRCHACYTLVTDTTKQFCPACGSGNTLKRVSYTVDAETGEKQIWINPHHRIVTRGQRYNLPKPRWGAHGTNRTLVLREDQLHDFGMKKRTKQNLKLRELKKSLDSSEEFGEKRSQRKGHQKLEKSSYKSFNVTERRILMASRRK